MFCLSRYCETLPPRLAPEPNPAKEVDVLFTPFIASLETWRGALDICGFSIDYTTSDELLASARELYWPSADLSDLMAVASRRASTASWWNSAALKGGSFCT